MERTYNGHKNYNYWNVSLWLFNDAPMYYKMKLACESLKDKDRAARYLLETLPEKTPDGVKFTFRNIREALKSFEV